ncbi:MAG: hypothetical protein GEU93_01545 [Propionibacteriales bacterium]|nr:hypothetical protein [Propionibacteriales bacterium]
MRSRRLAIAASSAILPALSLVACGSSGDGEEGQTYSGDGYSFTAPSGFEDATEEVKKSSPQVEVAFRSDDKVDEFSTNFNVVHGSQQKIGMKRLQRSMSAQVAGMADKPPEAFDRFKIDGESAIGQSFTGEQGGVDVAFRQYAAFHSKELFVITVTSHVDEAGSAESHIGNVLDSWSWE